MAACRSPRAPPRPGVVGGFPTRSCAPPIASCLSRGAATYNADTAPSREFPFQVDVYHTCILAVVARLRPENSCQAGRNALAEFSCISGQLGFLVVNEWLEVPHDSSADYGRGGSRRGVRCGARVADPEDVHLDRCARRRAGAGAD